MSTRLHTARTQPAAKAWPAVYSCVRIDSEQRRLTALKPNLFGMGSVAGSEDEVE